VKFDALDDAAERSYLKRLPTSFVLKPDEVDKLRDAARRILRDSREFQRLLRDLK
jgi:NTE family protein